MTRGGPAMRRLVMTLTRLAPKLALFVVRR